MLYKIIILLFSLFYYINLHSLVFDNRYLPLFNKPYSHFAGYSHARADLFIMNASKAYGDFDKICIPELDGLYNITAIAQSLVEIGKLKENIIRTDLQGIANFPFKRGGRISAQGMDFLYNIAINDWISFETNFLFMHINSRQEFKLNDKDAEIPLGDKNYLFNLNKELNELSGLKPAIFNKTGFGDIDISLRFDKNWRYRLKMRNLDLGLKLGAIIPTATRIDINNPASIPFGGSIGTGRFWGSYISLDSEFEIKEDWKLGLLFRIQKRFKTSSYIRLPINNEPTNYGPITGLVAINPGFTFIFNPYFFLEGIREGLGIQIEYTTVGHLKNYYNVLKINGYDSFLQMDNINNFDTDLSNYDRNKTIHVNLFEVQNRSSWVMEYLTIGIYYDTAKYVDKINWLPKLSLCWDIPVDWFVARRVPKTNAVSFMYEVDF